MKTISLLLVVLMIGLVSAGVTITPSTFTINTFPGESHIVGISINSDGNYTLAFNSSSPNMIINPENITVGIGELNTTLNLTFAGDIPAGVQTFEINKVVAVTPTQTQSSKGVASTTFVPSIPVVQNITNQTQSTEPIQNTTIISTNPEPKEKLSIPLIIILALAGCGIVAFVIIILMKKKGVKIDELTTP